MRLDCSGKLEPWRDGGVELAVLAQGGFSCQGLHYGEFIV